MKPTLWVLWAGTLIWGCSRHEAPAPVEASASREAVRGRLFEGRGVLRGLSEDGRTAVLEHQAIPGLMEAMTMGFPLRDPGLASGLKAGDSVAFTLDVTEDEMTVVSLKKR